MAVEILAPGGSKEAIYAAFYCGADAVYTGIRKFSARAFAQNPDVDELCEILDFAHLHGKRIYLTVNTLLTESELEEELYTLIKPLYETGLDAVIVQDFGVMDFLHENFPQMPLHASTQMTLLSGEAANLLKPYGVTRFVPARELSIGEIAGIRTQTDLEMEVFVHGALCYCYSGRCQMSNVIGGRSGNRGMCAQPCRLPYEVDGKKRGYILSPKDMCTLGQIRALVDAGVDSFKIEGRMKKPAYAAYTAQLYRRYADACLEGKDVNERELERDIQKLADIYNRGGFSEGYLFEPSKKNIIYPKKNGHYGVEAGIVTKVDKQKVEYRTAIPLHAQDVMEFRNEDGERLYEYTTKEGVREGQCVSTRYQKGVPLKKGQKVFRTRNNQLLGEIAEQIEKGKAQMQIPVSAVFCAKKEEAVKLEIRCSLNPPEIAVAEVYGVRAEQAIGTPVTGEDIEKRLRKTGNSAFCFEHIKMECEDGIFIPLGTIAALRREAFEKLEQNIRKNFHRQSTEQKKKERFPTAETSDFTLIQTTNLSQLEETVRILKQKGGNVRLHFKMDEFAPEEWKAVAELAGDIPYYLSFPRVMRAKNKKNLLKTWEKYGKSFSGSSCAGIVVSSLEDLPLLPQMAEPEWELLADAGVYMWNRRTQKVWEEFGIRKHIYQAYGRTEVMVTEGCVHRELAGCLQKTGEKCYIDITSPKKDSFTVVNHCDYCYNVIYEKNPGTKEPEDFAQIPEIKFTFETKEEIRKVLNKWNCLSSN